MRPAGPGGQAGLQDDPLHAALASLFWGLVAAGPCHWLRAHFHPHHRRFRQRHRDGFGSASGFPGWRAVRGGVGSRSGLEESEGMDQGGGGPMRVGGHGRKDTNATKMS